MGLEETVFMVAPPIFLAGFVFFSRAVSSRLPPERLAGWRLVRVGGLSAIAGLWIAAYFGTIKLGAAIGLLGVIVSAIGLARFATRKWRSAGALACFRAENRAVALGDVRTHLLARHTGFVRIEQF
jgi:hypothetical protein